MTMTVGEVPAVVDQRLPLPYVGGEIYREIVEALGFEPAPVPVDAAPGEGPGEEQTDVPGDPESADPGSGSTGHPLGAYFAALPAVPPMRPDAPVGPGD